MAMITADPQDVPKVDSFSFTPESMAKVNALIANYPPGRQASAVIGAPMRRSHTMRTYRALLGVWQVDR